MTLFVTTLPFGYLSLLDDVFLVDVRLVCLPFQLSYSNIILLLLCIRASSTDHLLEERPSVDSLLISADGHHSDGVHFCYFRRSVRIGRSSSAGRAVVHYSDY